MSSTIILIILAIVILAIFLWIGIRNNLQDRKLKLSLGKSLGLSQLTSIPKELTRQVISVHRTGQNHRLELRNVFSRTLPQGELYLFDLWESRSGYRGYLEQCAFAVTSSSAHLPQFSIIPRDRILGKPGSRLSPIITWAIRPSETELHMDFPGFDERYLLTGKDENAVRAALKPALLDYLVKSPALLLHANGQIFTVSAIDLYNSQKMPDLETVRRLYDQAIQIGSAMFG